MLATQVIRSKSVRQHQGTFGVLFNQDTASEILHLANAILQFALQVY